MTKMDPVTTALAVTDLTLREFFPNDFYKRCMYAAFGLAALLEDDGISAQVIGGEFLCAVFSEDQSQLSLQGFGNKGGSEPAHFWVHAQEHLLDLGPMYLPYESSFPASSPPVLRWPLSIRLPGCIAYRELSRYAKDLEISTPEISQRNADFLSACRGLRQLRNGPVSLGKWQLKDSQSLRYAAQKGDPWARGATEFLRRSFKAEFPER